MLPLWVRVDLGEIAITRTSPSLFSVISRTHIGWGFLPICRDTVGIFNSPSRQGNSQFDEKNIITLIGIDFNL